jgi:APA family basic amino acid/polyamine antiporter
MDGRPLTGAKFGAFSLTCLVVANTIGAGVYTTSGFTLADMGTPGRVLTVWMLAALMALAGAMSFAALSRAMPLSGGEYLFLSRLFHPAAGFIAGWVSLVAGFAGAQAYGALTITEYLSWPESYEKALVVSLLIALAATHGTLVKMGTIFQNFAVAAKAAFLTVFVLIGWWALPEEISQAATNPPPPADPGFWTWAFNVLMVGLAFTGFNAAIYVAEECEDPRRDIPRALFWGTTITAVLYLAVNAVYLYSAPLEQLRGNPRIALVSAQALAGPQLAKAVQALVLLSLFTLISGAAVSGPRVVKKMGEDGFLPPLTLSQASAIQCAFCVGMTLYSDLLSQLGYLSLTLSLVSALTVATVFRLPKEQRPWPIFPIIYLGATILTSIAALRRTPVIGVVAFATIIVGLVIYLALKGRHRIAAEVLS